MFTAIWHSADFHIIQNWTGASVPLEERETSLLYAFKMIDEICSIWNLYLSHYNMQNHLKLFLPTQNSIIQGTSEQIN